MKWLEVDDFDDEIVFFLLCLLMFGCCLYQQNVRWIHWTDEIISDLIFTRKLTSVLLILCFFVGLTVLRPGFIRFHNIIIGFHGDSSGCSPCYPRGFHSAVSPSWSHESQTKERCAFCKVVRCLPPHHGLLGAGSKFPWCSSVARFKWSITASSSSWKTKNPSKTY